MGTEQQYDFGKKRFSDSDQITRDYFDSLLLETRYIDAVLPSTQLKLFGETFTTPIMTAALSHLNSTCEDGMVKYAQGAKDAGAVHWIGMGSDSELEDIIDTGARSIKIIKPHADNKEVFRKIEHANAIGAFAIGMDIDHAFSSDGTYDTVLGLPMCSKSSTELKEFVKASAVPFIVKGVLSVIDAKKCVDAGVKGILLSHHHGIMEYSVPPLFVLPKIVEAVGNEIPVFIDCGIESGMDVYKALALGASAVCVGRHLMKPLKAGAAAVTERIMEMNRELTAVMARTGIKSLEGMDSTVIWHRNF